MHDEYGRLEQIFEELVAKSEDESVCEPEDTGHDAERVGGVLRHACNLMYAVTQRMSNLGHSVDRKGWKNVEEGYEGRCLMCGAVVTITGSSVRGQAVQQTCRPIYSWSSQRAAGK
jgi:hypothetical protein